MPCSLRKKTQHYDIAYCLRPTPRRPALVRGVPQFKDCVSANSRLCSALALRRETHRGVSCVPSTDPTFSFFSDRQSPPTAKMATTMDKVSALKIAHAIAFMKIANNVMSAYRSRTLSPRWPRPRRTRTPPSIWVRIPPSEHFFDHEQTGLTIGEGQLKAKLAKLKRELLTPTGGGGGGGGGECF